MANNTLSFLIRPYYLFTLSIIIHSPLNIDLIPFPFNVPIFRIEEVYTIL